MGVGGDAARLSAELAGEGVKVPPAQNPSVAPFEASGGAVRVSAASQVRLAAPWHLAGSRAEGRVAAAAGAEAGYGGPG